MAAALADVGDAVVGALPARAVTGLGSETLAELVLVFKVIVRLDGSPRACFGDGIALGVIGRRRSQLAVECADERSWSCQAPS